MSLRFSHPKPKRRGLITRFIGLIESKPASDRFILRTLFFVCVGSLLSAVIIWNTEFTNVVAVSGGTLIEGVVGTPRFVNPALAVTRADLDMTALVYAGLMSIDTEGNLVPNLAESVTVSGDGRTYNVILRNNVRFHDDTPLTARDVAFTIGLIQNADLKSPLRGNWSGVTVEEIGEYELNIVLEEAYAPFIENFTLGILPRHIWSELPIGQLSFSKKNTEPVGAGPFKIDRIIYAEDGLIEAYQLKHFTHNESVKLAGIEMRFYTNEADLVTAFNEHEIMSTANLPAEAARTIATDHTYTVIDEPLPRIFAVFFNQNRSPALRDLAVRQALASAIDRDVLVDAALSGFGVPITTPIPSDTRAVESSSQAATTTALETATTILTKAGWIRNNTGGWEKRIDGEARQLSITLRTANTPLFEETSETVARAWRELGVEVQVEQFNQSDLLQAVIRPRDFEGLLFGLDMSRAVDLYPFWHSSQREDPGLNVAQYANIEVDALLAKARIASSSELRTEATTAATDIIIREEPAAFLYVPSLVYVLDTRVTTAPIQNISKPQERFMNVGAWHMNTDRLWPFFNNH